MGAGSRMVQGYGTTQGSNLGHEPSQTPRSQACALACMIVCAKTHHPSCDAHVDHPEEMGSNTGRP
eukprot:666594-Pelagomonas_calceolata.AAC.6